VSFEFLCDGCVGHANDLCRENSCIGCAGLADGDRRHRNARRHLHGREQRIHALQRSGRDGHADDGQGCVRRDYARQVRRSARARDDHANAALRGLARVVCGAIGRAMR
jgi:hypothetical protein